ncbi:hypothetical protein RR46_03522 [Papilio xuthus]|uniref:Uncharacterized protein n=1 Tax=Papilio xuthus TaxID=66420 RepID=A0A194QJ24_PAPXU|nr:hypothetical protein RR46_03522 [Papilio xuthus]
MPSDSGAAWAPPASGERRLSNSSDGSAGSGYSKTFRANREPFIRMSGTGITSFEPIGSLPQDEWYWYYFADAARRSLR